MTAAVGAGTGTARGLGLLLGYAADRIFGDPRRCHPVAGFGAVANAVETRLYADSRIRGAAHAAILAGGAVTLGLAADRMTRRPTADHGVVKARIAMTAHVVVMARVVVTAAATWAVLGGRSLEREADAVHALLAAGDLPGARERLTHLVGRDTSGLGPGEIARAVVESVAENTSDAVVAPLLWGAVAGVGGLFGYRAANTLDAMVGHRNARYERYGWASARLDDLANLPGARLAGLLALAVSPSRAAEGWRVWSRDAAAHPSPNAGVIEAAFAGVLGVRLGGVNVYHGSGEHRNRVDRDTEHRSLEDSRVEDRRVEHRAIMDGGRPAEPRDIPRATRLARRSGLAAATVTAVIAVAAMSQGRGGPRA